MFIETLFLFFFGKRKKILTENERAIVLKNGEITNVLSAGKHLLGVKDMEYEFHNISATGIFSSNYQRVFLQKAADLAARHILDVHAETDEIKLVLRDGHIVFLLEPNDRIQLWKDAGPFQIQTEDISQDRAVASKLAKRVLRDGHDEKIHTFEVPEGSIGLLFADGSLAGQFGSGRHYHWKTGVNYTCILVDLRVRAHEVNGQEILTKDRVSLRVNISCAYRVTDAIKAITSTKHYEEALHRSLQFAFRKTLGAMTLDELLSEKVAVDEAAAQEVRAYMAEIGVEVREISLKDAILPGEMRDILNQVVAAQKEAEANIIRRREETNATRSLLNTAKVMADNPIMLRLKELEALESIAGNVDQLTIHNGTAGLMSDLVKLSDKS